MTAEGAEWKHTTLHRLYTGINKYLIRVPHFIVTLAGQSPASYRHVRKHRQYKAASSVHLFSNKSAGCSNLDIPTYFTAKTTANPTDFHEHTRKTTSTGSAKSK